jgi:hypothetical protein
MLSREYDFKTVIELFLEMKVNLFLSFVITNGYVTLRFAREWGVYKRRGKEPDLSIK